MTVTDLIERLRALARHEHSDVSIAEEAAAALEAARMDAERLDSGTIRIIQRDEFGMQQTTVYSGVDLRAAIDQARRRRVQSRAPPSPGPACSRRPKPPSTWASPRRPCAGGAGGVGLAGLRSGSPPGTPSTTCAPSWRPTNAPPPHHRPVLPRHPPRLDPLVSRMAGRRAKAAARYRHCRPWGSPGASPRADPRRRRDPGRRPGRDRPGRRARAVLAPAWACPPEPGHPEARDRAVGRVLGPAGGERLHGGPAGAIRALAGPEGPQRRLPAPRARRGEGGAEPRLEAG